MGCIKCNNEYDIQDEKCYLNIDGCNSYDYSGACINCEAVYELYDKKCYIEINGCE